MSGSVPCPSARHCHAASGSSGQSGVFRRSSAPRPASARMRADDVEVRGLGVVAGAHQGELGAVDVQPGAQHRDRLQRLERRPRPHRRVGVTQGEPLGPVGREHHDVADVHRLHQTAAQHPRERDRGGADVRHAHQPPEGPVGPRGPRPRPPEYGVTAGFTSTRYTIAPTAASRARNDGRCGTPGIGITLNDTAVATPTIAPQNPLVRLPACGNAVAGRRSRSIERPQAQPEDGDVEDEEDDDLQARDHGASLRDITGRRAGPRRAPRPRGARPTRRRRGRASAAPGRTRGAGRRRRATGAGRRARRPTS